MDISESRLAFVREKMGVANTVVARGDQSDIDALSAITNGQLADVVIDATGNNYSMVRALELTSFAGRWCTWASRRRISICRTLRFCIAASSR
jgi:alcohol dehydrogenase